MVWYPCDVNHSETGMASGQSTLALAEKSTNLSGYFGYIPVRRLAREAPLTGTLQYALRNTTPEEARRSILGVFISSTP